MDVLKEKIWMVKVPEVLYNQILREKDLGMIDLSDSGKDLKNLKVRLGGNIDPKNFEIKLEKANNFFIFKDKKSQLKPVDYKGSFIASSEDVSDRMTINVYKEEL